jgi:voltage-gated potassium channel
MAIQRKLLMTGCCMVGIFLIGIIGYSLIENWNFIDALYMTVITLTTVGFSEVKELTIPGRLFTIFLLISGLGIFLYGITTLGGVIIEGELKGIFQKRRMEKLISKLKNHIIICGVGRTGKYIVKEFLKTKTEFICIEKNNARLEELQEELGTNFFYLSDDATKSEVLIKANVKTAKGLITTLPEDKDNLFIILTAKELQPKLKIISRAIQEDAIDKLYKSGADYVVLSDAIGGLRMASQMIRPHVVNFLDEITKSPKEPIRFEEIELKEDSKLVGKPIKELKDKNLLVLAVKKSQTKDYIFNPDDEIMLTSGDILIVCTKVEDLEKLRKL